MPPRLISITAAMLLCLANAAAAQVAVVQGTVVDDRTELSIPHALIAVQGEAASVQSGDNGSFSIALSPGPHTLIVSAIGYAVATVTLAADESRPPASVTIRLAEGSGTYSEHVDVIGSSGGQQSGAPVGGMTLYGRDLQNLRGAILDDPLRAIQSLPAVSATDDFYSEFAVRGSSFRHINLTVDGIPSKFLMHTVNDIMDGGSVTMVNSETLGAVELLPGSYPQKTGRHLGAEVNLLTRDGSRERFRGRAGLSGTSATFLGEGPLPHKRGAWLASVRRSYLDYLIKRIDPTAGFAFGFTDAQTKMGFDLSPHNQLQFIALLGRAAFEGGGNADSVNDTAAAISHSWLSSVGWQYTGAHGLTLANRAYATGLDFDNRNPSDAALDSARFSNIGWRADGSLLATSHALLRFGGDAFRMDGRHTRQAAPPGSTTLIPAGDYQESTAAASAYLETQMPVRNFTVTAGLRADHWPLTRSSTVSPWVNLAANLGSRTVVKAGAGIYRQFAELDQVFGLNGGGASLRPERAIHADVAVEERIGGSTTLSVTAFFRRESDVLWTTGSETHLVNNRIVPGAFTAKWTNALAGDARGGEIALRRDSPSGLSGWIGYAYGELRYDQSAGQESFWANADQRHTLATYGNYRITGSTSVSARYRFGSNYPIIGYLTAAPAAPTNPDTDGPAYYQLTTVRNTVRLPAYSRIDLRADHAFHWSARRLVVFVEVANVQNRKNLRNTPYGVDRNGRAFGVTETMMPIVPSAGFVVEF